MGSRRWAAETGVVLGAYAVLAVGMTWPLAAHFTTALPDGSDGWQYLWNLWWMKTALVDLHTNPFHTDLLYYPHGVSLLFDTLTPLLGVISIPFQLLGMSLPAVYNLLVMFSFVAGGYGAYLLVRRLTGARAAAFVAGLIFAFCPYHFAHLRGHLNLLSLQWLPFYVLALHQAWDDRASYPHRALHSALAGLWLAVNAYTEWTYALFLGLFTIWYVAWRLLSDRRGSAWRAGLGSLVVTGGVALALVAPVLVPMVAEARASNYMQATPHEVAFFSSDLTDAFMPNLFHPLWLDHGAAVIAHYGGRPPAEIVVFVGYTVLLVGIATVWALRGRTEVRFWGLTALGGWILSLGPILHIWGQSIFGGIRIPLPYAALYFLPFFNIFRVPARFMVVVMLALAVLVGYGLAAYAGRGMRVSRAACVAVGALVLAEFLAVPYPTMALRDAGGFYEQAAREPGQFAILDLPLTPLATYLGYQTVHHRPIVDGHLSRQPPDPFITDTPVLRYLLPSTPADDPLAAEAARTGLADLRRAGVRYAVVHWWATYGKEQDDLRTKLARVFPGLASRPLPDQQMEIFTLNGN